MSGLNTERMVLSGGPIGIMQATMDICLPYVHERKQFGKPIGVFELMQGKMADMYVALQSTRAFAYRVAEQYDKGNDSRKDAAALLLFASENAVKVALEGIQTLGGMAISMNLQRVVCCVMPNSMTLVPARMKFAEC